jgi:hypothetical protein
MILHVSCVIFLVTASIFSGRGLSGVRYNVPSGSLSSIGCEECDYSMSIASKDLTSCTGPYIIFGLKSSVMDVFDIDIGAYKEVPGAGVKGAPSVFDSPFEYDGTFWYFTGGNQGMSKAGAATVTESDETSADDGSCSTSGPIGRVDEGKIASSKVTLNTDLNSVYRKVAFTCPAGILDQSCNLIEQCDDDIKYSR